MTDKKKLLKIKFHSANSDGSCYADVELPETGKRVNYIKLKREANGKLSIRLPKFMNNRWTYNEITQRELYKKITEEYEKFFALGGNQTEKNIENELSVTDEQKSLDPTFTFSSLDTKISAVADVSFPDIGIPLNGIFVQGNLSDNTVFVKKPDILSDIAEFNEKVWYDAVRDIEYSFRRSFMELSEERETVCEVCFKNENTFYTCLADAHFVVPKKEVGGFSVKIFSNGRVKIAMPHYMSSWNEKLFNWVKLTRLMSAAVLEKYPVVSEFSAKPRNEKAGEKEFNRAGRIANAEKSDFRYIKGSVLVSDESVPDSEKKNIHILAAAMSKGTLGGIGPFEFGVLKWVAKLKYLTTVMIQELTFYGYIDVGWRGSIKKDKYPELIRRMLTFDMLDRSRFGTLDEEGVLSNDKFSISKVLTVGKNGGRVLKEFFIDGNRYNSFDVIRDALTIKSYLTVNQWLIYWLRAYKNRIGDNFEAAFIMKRMGAQYTAARLYAVVQVDDKVLVGEAVRRWDEKQRETSYDFLRNKLDRMIEIFDHPDEMYRETKKITYPSRPIINLVCEDDEHIKEVYSEIKDIINDNPQQKIWFTHDLRVFNENNIGQRFVSMDSGEMQIIDLKDIFGADDEAETALLLQKFTIDTDQNTENEDEIREDSFFDDEEEIVYPDGPDEFSADEYVDDDDENEGNSEGFFAEEGDSDSEISLWC